MSHVPKWLDNEPPEIRSCLNTTIQFCEIVILTLRTQADVVSPLRTIGSVSGIPIEMMATLCQAAQLRTG
eukprot:15430199-Alexandrium_andersonii.AAC.1